jgi:dihydrofolate reductase
MGKPIIMGRRTYESIGKPLDGRDNIVVTRNAELATRGVSTCDTVADALTLARVLATTRGADEIMVIGGARIFAHVLPFANRVYLTRIEASPEGDTYFEPLAPSDWVEKSREMLPKGPRDDHSATLIVYERPAD